MGARLAALPAVLLVSIASIALAGCDLFVEPSGPTPDDFARARAAYDETEPAPEPEGDPAAADDDAQLQLRRALHGLDRESGARLPPEPRAAD